MLGRGDAPAIFCGAGIFCAACDGSATLRRTRNRLGADRTVMEGRLRRPPRGQAGSRSQRSRGDRRAASRPFARPRQAAPRNRPLDARLALLTPDSTRFDRLIAACRAEGHDLRAAPGAPTTHSTAGRTRAHWSRSGMAQIPKAVATRDPASASVLPIEHLRPTAGRARAAGSS